MQEAGYDFLSVCCVEHGGPRSEFGPCSVLRVGLAFRPCAQARAWFINPGWEEFAFGCGGNFTGGRQGRTPAAPELQGDLQGAREAGEATLEPERSDSLLDTGWPGWTPKIAGSLPSQGRGGKSPGPLEHRGRRRTLAVRRRAPFSGSRGGRPPAGSYNRAGGSLRSAVEGNSREAGGGSSQLSLGGGRLPACAFFVHRGRYVFSVPKRSLVPSSASR